jgi:hypothetical protein
MMVMTLCIVFLFIISRWKQAMFIELEDFKFANIKFF